MNTNIKVQVGSRVYVNFTSESRTEFSGREFNGEGFVDLFDDRYVMGRLDDGLPFMCSYADLTVIDIAPIRVNVDPELSSDAIVSAIHSGGYELLNEVADAMGEKGFDFDSYCSCDLDAEVEIGRRTALIELIERINIVGLKDALGELRQEGFMLGAHIDCKKLES